MFIEDVFAIKASIAKVTNEWPENQISQYCISSNYRTELSAK